MKTMAAVLVETERPLEIADLEVPTLQPGQVLVEIAYSGVCHTQLLECRGARGEDRFLPHCLGHEGSGVVLEAGKGVQRVRTGDSVVLSWIKGHGADVPSTVYEWNGGRVNAGGITTFSRHAVISENRVTPVPRDLPLAEAALLGCALPTGMGAVLNTAAAQSGRSIAVFGCGGVGMCALIAASLAGCDPVIALDLHAEKLELARQYGATHLIDASRCDPVEEVRKHSPGGVDIAIEATGVASVMGSALSVVRPRGGTTVVVGNAPSGQTFPLDPSELNQGKRLLGTWGGDCVPGRDLPRFAEMLRRGHVDTARLLSRRYPLGEINVALEDLESGRVVRPLIQMVGA